MATSLLSPNAKQKFDKLDGTPASGYKLWTYATGTVNPLATYSNRAGTSANTNPIILDARGEATVYLTPGLVYDYKLTNAADVLEWTQPGVSVGGEAGVASMTTTFGAVGDNVTDNTAAFAAAESSAFQRIYLPEGTYYHAGPMFRQKHYYGPGVIRGSAVDYFPARYTYMSTTPFSGAGTGYNKFFNADLTATDARYFINRADRIGFDQLYYAPETSSVLSIYDNGSGTSGIDARFTAATLVGATSATLNSTAGLANGDVVTFFNPTSGLTSAQKTITVAGSVVSWTGGLTEAMPIGSQVSLGGRTMHSQNHLELVHSGGGDAYVNLMRVYVGGDWAGKPGKDHVFFTTTAGMDGGDMVAQSDHVYMTGREIMFDGLSYDCAVLGDIRSFSRNSAAATRGAFWIGSLLKSEGTQPCDAAHAVAGAWKCALDTTRGFFGSNGGCAINMGADQYQYFDSQQDPSELYPVWGKLLGDTKHGYNSTTTSFELTVNGTLITRTSSTKHIVVPDLEVQKRITGTALHNNASGMAGLAVDYVGSGTYTPTATNVGNLDAITVHEAYYTRVGRVVHVAGSLTLDAALASTLTTLYLTLPIASDMTTSRRLSGTVTTSDIANGAGRVYANNASDLAVVQFFAPGTGSYSYSYTYTYLME